MSSNLLHFILGDRLPTIYDVAIQIYQICPTLTSAKSKKVVSAYVDALLELWQKSFGVGHTVSKPVAVKRVENTLKDCVKEVTGRESYGDKERGIPPKSVRILNQEWRVAPASPFGKSGPRGKKKVVKKVILV